MGPALEPIAIGDDATLSNCQRSDEAFSVDSFRLYAITYNNNYRPDTASDLHESSEKDFR